MIARWFLWGLLVGMLGAPLAAPERLPCHTRNCIDSIGRPVFIYLLRFVRGNVIVRLAESHINFGDCGDAPVLVDGTLHMLGQGELRVVAR